MTSIYAVDPAAADAGLPDLDAFVLVCATRTGVVARALTVTSVELASQRRVAIKAGLAAGATEWHVHLIAAERRDRTAAVADLLDRHRPFVPIALSA